MRYSFQLLSQLFRDALQIFGDLSKRLIPAIIVVKILQEVGAVSLLATLLQPFMHLFGLPGEMALVWTTAIVTNIYGGIAVLMMFTPHLTITTAQMTVLSLMILICHSLPIELALTNKVGAKYSFLGPFRFIGACIAGLILHQAYSITGVLTAPAAIRWVAPKSETTLLDWITNQVWNLGYIFLVIFALLTMMRFLKYIRLTSLLARVLRPILLVMGISERGASIAVFGLLAGITFGSGLLLAEAKENALDPKDLVLILAFLSLCHGIIEDTTLMLLIGADLGGILAFRLIFSITAIAVLARMRRFKLHRLCSLPSA